MRASLPPKSSTFSWILRVLLTIDFMLVLARRHPSNMECRVEEEILNFPDASTTMVLEDLWCDLNTTATGSFTATVQPHDVVAVRMSPKVNRQHLRNEVVNA